MGWRGDLDLAGLRQPGALAKLSAEERKEWLALWGRWRPFSAGRPADEKVARRDMRVLAAAGEEEAAWTLPTGKGVQTHRLEFEPVPPR